MHDYALGFRLNRDRVHGLVFIVDSHHPQIAVENLHVDASFNGSCTFEKRFKSTSLYSNGNRFLYSVHDGHIVGEVIPDTWYREEEICAPTLDGKGNAVLVEAKGEMIHEEEKKDKAWQIREHRWGAFERSVMLPTGVISDRAKADFENGILTVTLPKSEEVKPKTITIKAK